MKRWLTPVLMVITSVVASTATAADGDRLDRSRLGPVAFSDEFDGRQLSFYSPKTGKGTWKTNFFYAEQSGVSSRMAGEAVVVDLDYAGTDPFELRDGQVYLTLRRNPRPKDPRLGGAKYTAGLLTTERSFSQTYGYWEAKVTMPDLPGTWPAFWLWSAPVKDLTGKQWMGEWTGGLSDEIDVVEGQGVRPGKTLHTAHRRFAWRDRVGGEVEKAAKVESRLAKIPSTADPHVYGLLWTQEDLIWYVDDAEVFRCANFGLNSPMYVILSMGAGGWDGNDIRPEFSSAQMHVDYVRVFPIKGDPAKIGATR